jgi:hypothetical protein
MKTSPYQVRVLGIGSQGLPSQEPAMRHGVSAEVFRAAVSAAVNAPDAREERVTLAAADLDAGRLDADAVAKAMICRILAESVR